MSLAVLGGAANMLGVSPNLDNSIYSIPLEDSPSSRQGFGRVMLSQTLPLNGSRINLQVILLLLLTKMLVVWVIR